MSIDQILADKIKKVQQSKMTEIKATGQMTIGTWTTWLHRVANRYDFGKEIVNLSEVLAEKLQYLLHGKPYIIENETIDQNELGKFIETIMLQDTMFANEKLLFEKGAGYVIIEAIGNENKPKIQLRLAEPNFPNKVVRLGNIKIRAEVWSTFKYNIANYYQQTIYTQDYIENNVFQTEGEIGNIDMAKDKINLEEFNKLIPKQLRIKDKIPNPWKFIPVVEVQYYPTMDYSWKKRWDIAPMRRVQRQQLFLNDATRVLSLELHLNRTKILVDKDLLDKSNEADLQTIAKEDIIGVLRDSGGVDGENKTVEIIQGNPKITEYWENIKNIISLSITSLKLSELSEEQSNPSATGEIFNKGNDVETGNTLQIFRQKSISEIMCKAWAMKNGDSFEEQDIDMSDWNIQLIPNVIMNEAKMTEIVVQQLQAGLLSMAQAKVKLEGISTEDAKNSLEEVVADDGAYNPQLEAVGSWGDKGQDKSEPLIKDKGNEIQKGK